MENVRLKHVANITAGQSPESAEVTYTAGGLPFLQGCAEFGIKVPETEKYCQTPPKIAQKGSWLISVRAPVGTLNLADQDYCIGRGLAAVSTIGADQGYLGYLLLDRGSFLNAISTGSTFQAISTYQLENLEIALPPFDIQRRVSSFLDDKTAQIDGLIKKKRELLDRLAEKRKALITRAVTKGLNSDVSMKPSGIEWLGEIPAHWDIQRLDRLTEPLRPIRYGIVLPGPHVSNGVPIIKGGDVRQERLNLETLSRTTIEIDAAHSRSRLRAGDIVYSIRGSFGDVELLPSELDGVNITQDAARIAPIKEVDREWLLFTLKSDAIRLQMAASAIGATIKGINIRDLRRAVLPLPPRAEQNALKTWLNFRVAEIDRLIGSVSKSSILLKEYRAALVTAAVTGKIMELV